LAAAGPAWACRSCCATNAILLQTADLTLDAVEFLLETPRAS
jgi:hypothetical protein